jgi:hypothetical protein
MKEYCEGVPSIKLVYMYEFYLVKLKLNENNLQRNDNKTNDSIKVI